MNQEERLEFLIEYLLEENGEGGMLWAKQDADHLFTALRNTRGAKPIPPTVEKIQDEYLQERLENEGIVMLEDIKTIGEELHSKNEFADKISIWQGDISKLQIGAIVNAANSEMLGCFAPLHKCIDNVIHSGAGMQLREECNRYMENKRQDQPGYLEPTGSAMITDAYNLPSDYIIHTVGPIVEDELTDSLKQDLANSYRNSLEAAIEKEIRTIAFCCISTGVFKFPNYEAAQIAVKTVENFLEDNGDKIDRVVFNVFKDEDRDIYKELLSSKEEQE